MRSPKTGGLLTQVHYSEKRTFGDLKGRSLHTGGFKERFDCNTRLVILVSGWYLSMEFEDSFFFKLGTHEPAFGTFNPKTIGCLLVNKPLILSSLLESLLWAKNVTTYSAKHMLFFILSFQMSVGDGDLHQGRLLMRTSITPQRPHTKLAKYHNKYQTLLILNFTTNCSYSYVTTPVRLAKRTDYYNRPSFHHLYLCFISQQSIIYIAVLNQSKTPWR